MELNSELIKQRRQAKGWTQQHFADATGLSLRTIQRIEREGNAARETALALCATLEIDLAQLSVIPQVREDQLQPTDLRRQWLPLVLALFIGAAGGALLTYWIAV